MRGRVLAYGPPCPKCGEGWESVKDQYGDTVNIVCRVDLLSPMRYCVDGRPFRNRKGTVGRLFRDDRGELLYSFHAAKRLLEAIRADWDKQGPERFDPTRWSRSGRESYKLSECAREWQIHLERSNKSRAYCQHVEIFFRKHILPALDIDIREVTSDDIEKLQLTLREKGLSANSVKSCLQVLCTLMRRYHIRKKVLDRVEAFPEGWSETPHIKRRVVSEEDQRIIIDRMPEEVRLLMTVYVALGCRPGEVCALTRKDVLGNGNILIQSSIDIWGNDTGRTKNGESREAEIPPDLHAKLRSLPVLPDGYLFTKKDGRPYNPNRLSSMFKRVAGDYPGVTLYTFGRHSLASRIAREAREEGVQRAARAIGNTAEVARIHYVQE